VNLKRSLKLAMKKEGNRSAKSATGAEIETKIVEGANGNMLRRLGEDGEKNEAGNPNDRFKWDTLKHCRENFCLCFCQGVKN
jgi:hypothetical protein